MGFVITVDEDNDKVAVTLNGQVVSTFSPKNLKEGLKKQLEWCGGDYLE